MTSTIDYTAAARNAQTAFTTTLDSWKDGINLVNEQLHAFPTAESLPQVDATEAVERQFAFIKQIVDLNHEYARQLAEVTNTLTGVTRKQIESVGSVVRERAGSVTEIVRSGADAVEDAVREQADQAEAAEREHAREAAKAERRARKEAQDNARERYADLSKAELTDQAAKRGLQKSGTVAELIERLVEADTK